ncbi:hypothetical protein QQF64_029707 [Cirrhinus molitorella]|uniref:Uncharacterized protein n=1 Tax=Cirrhinus molitorella TaxID=172907 RepID=A0ABR3N1J8_9TELE
MGARSAPVEVGAKGAPYDVTQPPASFLMGKVTLRSARHKRGERAITSINVIIEVVCSIFSRHKSLSLIAATSNKLRCWFEEVVKGSRRVGGGYHTGKTSSQISSASAAICYSIRERPIQWLPSHCLLATSRNSGLRAGEQKLGPMEPCVFSKCNSSPCRHGPVLLEVEIDGGRGEEAISAQETGRDRHSGSLIGSCQGRDLPVCAGGHGVPPLSVPAAQGA